jgi:acyl-CoA thioesterase YciA
VSAPDIPPSDTTLALRVVAMPADTNPAGDIFGGWLMAQVDTAGSVPAFIRAGGRVATVSVDAFTFKQPVRVGDLVSFYADIIATGHTSVTVRVVAYAQRIRTPDPTPVKVTEATLVFVALDAAGRKRPLPPAPGC